MKKRKLWKDIRKSITHSTGRFISIMLLMALGSFALVGLVVSGPNMRATGREYFDKYNSADITIMSDYGLDKSEQEAIEQIEEIKQLEYIYLKDVTVENSDVSFRVFSKPKNISLYELVEGNFPENDDEIAIDNKYREDYKLGENIIFSEKLGENEENTLKRHKFKIVGYINSSEIILRDNRGQTTVGTGELNSFGIVNETVFDSKVYMMAKVKFDDTNGVDPYSEQYNNLIQNHKTELEEILQKQQDTRLASIKSEYQKEIDKGQNKIDKAKSKLEDAREKLDEANNKIKDAKKKIKDNEKKLENANKKIKNAESQIKSNEKYLNEKKQEYKEAVKNLNLKKSEIQEAEKEINAAQKEIDKYNSIMPGIPEIVQKQKVLDAKKEELEKAKASIAQGEKKLENAKVEIENGEKQLKSAKSKLSKSKTEYNSSVKKLKDAKQELADKEKEYKDKKQEFKTKEKDANKEIAERRRRFKRCSKNFR